MSTCLLTMQCSADIIPLDNQCLTIPHPTKVDDTYITSPYTVSHDDAAFMVQLFYKDSHVVSSYSISCDLGFAMHIFNFDDGWTIIAGDKRMRPILASSETGYLDPTNIKNDGLLTWIDVIKDEFNALTMNNHITQNEYLSFWNSFKDKVFIDKNYLNVPMTKSSDIMYYWRKEFQYAICDTTLTYEKNHLIQTQWGQRFPWNRNFPKTLRDSVSTIPELCPAGCSAVAMGQIMKYLHDAFGYPTGLHHSVTWSSPDSINVTVQRSNYFANSGLWSQMAINNLCYDINKIIYTRNLLLEIGGAIGMQYTPTGSRGPCQPPQYALFGINCIKSNYSGNAFFSIVYPELLENRPVNIVAYTDEGAGHSWIIDGVVRQNLSITRYYRWMRYEMPDIGFPVIDHYELEPAPEHGGVDNHEFDHEIGEVVIETTTNYKYYLLMNWGYDGENDNALFSIYSSADEAPWDYHEDFYRYNMYMMHGFSQL